MKPGTIKIIFVAAMLAFSSSLDAQKLTLRGDLGQVCDPSEIKIEKGYQIVEDDLDIGINTTWTYSTIVYVDSLFNAYKVYSVKNCDELKWIGKVGKAAEMRNDGRSTVISIGKDHKSVIYFKRGLKCSSVLAVADRDDGRPAFLVCLDDGKKGSPLYRWIDEDEKQLPGTGDYSAALVFRDSPYETEVCENGLWGLVSRTGKLVVPPHYKEMSYTADIHYWKGIPYERDFFVKNTDDYWGVISFDGNEVREVFPCEYEFVGYNGGCSDIWLLRKRGGKMGAYHTDRTLVLDADYDELDIFNFRKEIAGENILPTAFAASRNGKWGLVDTAGNILIPFKYSKKNLMNVQAMFYPLNSFSIYVYNRYHLWQKGEFESRADFEARQKDPEVQRAYLASIIHVAEKEFISRISEDKSGVLILSSYNPDDQTFTFSHSLIFSETYHIAVPKDDAPMFKSEFDSMKGEALRNASYFICEDAVSLRGLTFTASNGKTFVYENPASQTCGGASMKKIECRHP